MTVALVLSIGCGCAGSTSAARDEQQLVATEKRWDDAILQNDTRTLETVLDSRFIFTDVDGAIYDRPQVLKQTPSASKKAQSNSVEDRRVSVFGDAAIITGRYVEQGLYSGKPYRINSRYTDVYVRSGREWKAVAAQASGRHIALGGKPVSEK